jgi:hypothetical protein
MLSIGQDIASIFRFEEHAKQIERSAYCFRIAVSYLDLVFQSKTEET